MSCSYATKITACKMPLRCRKNVIALVGVPNHRTISRSRLMTFPPLSLAIYEYLSRYVPDSGVFTHPSSPQVVECLPLASPVSEPCPCGPSMYDVIFGERSLDVYVKSNADGSSLEFLTAERYSNRTGISNARELLFDVGVANST